MIITNGMGAAETPQMRAEWVNYFATSKPGQKIEWAGGTLTKNADGSATYRALDAMNGGDTFDANVNFENIAKYNPGIARQWWRQFGFTPSDNQYYFAGHVINGVENAVNWRVQPGMPGTGWSGQDNDGNYVFDMELMQIWMRDTGTSFDPYKLSVNYKPTAAPTSTPHNVTVVPVVNSNTGIMTVSPVIPITPVPVSPTAITPTTPSTNIPPVPQIHLDPGEIGYTLPAQLPPAKSGGVLALGLLAALAMLGG